MFEAPFVLKLWLGNVPEHTVSFLRLILVSSLLYSLSNPIIVSVHATGKLKKFQIVEGTMLLSIVPIAYFLLKYFCVVPEYVFLVHILVESCTQIVRLKIVLPMINMQLVDYFKKVILPIVFVVILTPLLPFVIHEISFTNEFWTFLATCSLSVVSCLLIIYTIGCSSSERCFLNNKAKLILRKWKN